jgi:methylmalonyl-CoA/ethylmalonyl-CoA epimerase
MNNIEHIGIAVKNLDRSSIIYEKLLGVKSYKRQEVESEGVTTEFFKVGHNKVELLEASSPDSPIAKFIANSGEGIHHLAFKVDDIYAEMDRLKREGFRLLSDVPKLGADNKLICFVHPKDASGVLIELCQDIVP